ncbi:MAG: ribbon-helix-helix protein, CopG family [Myxococcales bacterium]|nr:ribbon-helix-helix protein, CopG family [Myxococcales bacterium]
MAKKQVTVSIRKPSSSPQSETSVGTDADAFVHGGRAGFRMLSLSLPTALAERLAQHCKETGRDSSAVMEEIVRRHLDALDAPKVAEPTRDPLAAVVAWVQAHLPRLPLLARFGLVS